MTKAAEVVTFFLLCAPFILTFAGLAERAKEKKLDVSVYANI